MLGYIDKGRAEGAAVAMGGGTPAALSNGCYVEPTLFTGVTNQMTIARDREAGVCWINFFDHRDMTSIWGGFKQTGNGRDKCFEALSQYTQTKSVWLNLG